MVWNNQGGSANDIHQDFDLTDFNEEDMQGSWELWIKDTAGSDTGTLTGWSLAVTTSECNPYTGLPGDVNSDGVVTALDLSLLANYLAGNVEANQLQLSRADLDGSGTVNAVDLLQLQRSL